MSNMIYGKQNQEIIPSHEVVNQDIEDRFIKELIQMICDGLKVGHNDRRLVVPLLYNYLNNKLDCRYPDDQLGLLQQYQAYVLDESSKRIVDRLELGDVGVKHSHALHAKFEPIIKKIEELYEDTRTAKLPASDDEEMLTGSEFRKKVQDNVRKGELIEPKPNFEWTTEQMLEFGKFCYAQAHSPNDKTLDFEGLLDIWVNI